MSKGAITDRMPPFNLNAEISVLASMLINEQCVDDIRLVMKPSDLWRDSHQIICNSIYWLKDNGKPVDSIFVEERLKATGELEKIGGVDAILDIQGSEPDSSSALYYAHIVIEKAISREALQACNETIIDIYSDDHDSDTLVSKAEQRIFAIRDGRTENRLTTGEQSARNFIADLEARARGDAKAAVSTPWSDLNKLVPRCFPGQLILIAARPSMGKTAMALQIGLFNSFFQDHNTLFASLEMSELEIGGRIIAVYSGVSGEKVDDPRTLTNRDRDRMNEALTVIGAEPRRFIIDDSAAMSVAHIAAQARRLRSRNGLGLVMVDYIQLVSPINMKESRQEQVAKISRDLKRMGKELGVPVIGLSQLNRASEGRADKRPALADLRETGALEQDADIVLLLHRPDYYDPNDQRGICEVNVAKNRNGPTDTIKLTFVKHLTRFDSLALPAQQDAAF